eukprot:2836512-Pyramimonas_sp.AAC.1
MASEDFWRDPATHNGPRRPQDGPGRPQDDPQKTPKHLNAVLLRSASSSPDALRSTLQARGPHS